MGALNPNSWFFKTLKTEKGLFGLNVLSQTGLFRKQMISEEFYFLWVFIMLTAYSSAAL
jgi:hypothetical protein